MNEIIRTEPLSDAEIANIYGDAAPYIIEADRCYRDIPPSLSESARRVWISSQAFREMRKACKHGTWRQACLDRLIDPDRATRILRVIEEWPDITALPNCCGELLITITAPSVTEQIRGKILEQVENGEAPSDREAKKIIATENKVPQKPSAPTEFDHDVDRTRQEPEDGELTPKQVVKLLTAILRAAQKAKDSGVPWKLVREQLQLIAGETGDNLVGLDEATIRGLLR